MQPDRATDLKSHLNSLHADLSRTPEVDEELRRLLTQLDGDIRALLEQRVETVPVIEPEPAYGLSERTREITARFAARHPRLEPALRELGNMLSNMGI